VLAKLASVPPDLQERLPSFSTLLSSAPRGPQRGVHSHVSAHEGCVSENPEQFSRLNKSLGQARDSGKDEARVTHSNRLEFEVNTLATVSREDGDHCKETLGSTARTAVSSNEIPGPPAGRGCPVQLKPKYLQILPGNSSASLDLRCPNPPYMVQYEVKDGANAWKSKAWGIYISASETRQYGPELDVYIYHDVDDPYRYRLTDQPSDLLRLTPPMSEWLRVRLGYSLALVKGATPTLAETAESRSPGFRKKLVQWDLNPANMEVLKLASIRSGMVTLSGNRELQLVMNRHGKGL
jgi:hypothetical protein